MAKQKPDAPQPDQQAIDQPGADKKQEIDFSKCPYWGMGGRWIVNPETGCREPADDETREMVRKLEEANRLEQAVMQHVLRQ